MDLFRLPDALIIHFFCNYLALEELVFLESAFACNKFLLRKLKKVLNGLRLKGSDKLYDSNALKWIDCHNVRITRLQIGSWDLFTNYFFQDIKNVSSIKILKININSKGWKEINYYKNFLIKIFITKQVLLNLVELDVIYPLKRDWNFYLNDYISITNQQINEIAQYCASLTKITFVGCRKINNDGINHLIKNCCFLETINIVDMNYVDINCFEETIKNKINIFN